MCAFDPNDMFLDSLHLPLEAESEVELRLPHILQGETVRVLIASTVSDDADENPRWLPEPTAETESQDEEP